MALVLAIATVFLACWFCYKLYNRELEKLAESLPGDKPLPIVGNALSLISARNLKDIIKIIRDYTTKYEKDGIVKVWLGPILMVFVFDTKHVEAVAESPHASHKGNIYNHFLGEVFHGVFAVSGGDDWKELKKPLTKSLTKKCILNEYHRIFIKRNKDFIDYLKEEKCGNIINIIDELRHLTFQIITETHFGLEVDEVRNPKFYWLENLDRFLEYAGTGGVRNPFQFVKVFKNFTGLPKPVENSVNEIMNYSKWVFEERKKCLAGSRTVDGKEYYPDFLMRRGVEKLKPLLETCKELNDLISGGADTTSATLASAVVFLAMFPQLQEEAYQEQLSIFGNNSAREPTVDDLASMEFLGRIMKETLRHASPFIYFKVPSENLNIGEYTVPKRVPIAIFTEPVHFNKKYWEKPNEFYPDHFLPEMEAARPAHAYLPFGFGVRICTGIQYSTNSMKITLSYIIRNFKIHTDLKFNECNFDYRLLRVLASGYKVRLEERNFK